MASLFRLVKSSLRKILIPRASSLPLHFPSTGFPPVSHSILLKEEHLDEFKSGQYYPAKLEMCTMENIKS